ncbi:type II toxin-antitoxin system tRNA(fMet)-specific endonuclease VapC [Cyclobacterium jeungdonense]|uniref:Ribonuclease VapC n=1 Tax=Cyclobacterium jeungdonense TaxID=708087 RepID=A0ABT8CFK6_9BACT|nr:type II toxin-antitoxin system VapC family toxin [Cyclobacterium jeungdonense]MDN3690495.1 type II toxin-antitoxin system VapC family toxin [Cyclobacterium jeungdonense]
MYLLDTNICIYLIKNRPEIVLKKFRSYPISMFRVSAVTITELYYGVAKSKRKKTNEDALIQFLAPFEFVSFTDADAIAYGEIRAELERIGQVIGAYDLQIAAQAISRKITLVTNNIREFQRLPGLVCENWATSG